MQYIAGVYFFLISLTVLVEISLNVKAKALTSVLRKKATLEPSGELAISAQCDGPKVQHPSAVPVLS
jgi:hypothetical protein